MFFCRKKTDLVLQRTKQGVFPALAGLLFFALIVAWPASAEDSSLLQGELWTELEPVELGIPQAKPDTDKQLRTILEEARHYFSGMIWGYTFSYVPYDKARNIAEKFIITQNYVMPWGAKGLSFTRGEIRNALLFWILRYEPTLSERSRVDMWRKASVPVAGGIGKGPIDKGTDGKQTAFEQACKQAVRDYARALTRNKPDEVRGTFALTQLPGFRVVDGAYLADVRMRLHIEDIDAYRTY